MRGICFVLLCSCVVACGGNSAGNGPDGGPGVVCIGGLTSIALAPTNASATLSGATAPSMSFTATGRFADGHSETLDPARLAWSATRGDDTDPGHIAAGVLAPNPSSGGTVTITATDGCVSGSTTVHFDLIATISPPGNPGDWTGPPTTSGTLPIIVYPQDQTRFPRNIYRTLFQWRTGGYSQFRLTFTGPGGTLTVFTDGANPLCAGKNPAAGCWEADATAWAYLAGSNAGATVTWNLDALDTSTPTPTVRRAARAITIGFSKRNVNGAIFYWSTSAAGVRRANIADPAPEDYVAAGTAYTSPSDTVKCVACHVVSRDGQYLVASTQSQQWAQTQWVYQVTAQPPPGRLLEGLANTNGHTFATISPDDRYLVASSGAGAMWQLDRATGTKLVDLPLGGVFGTQPDWSPDNTQIVFSVGKGDGSSPSAIDVLGFGGGTTWSGPPVTLVANGGKANLFPQFSPDGRYVAFARGNSAAHGEKTLHLQLTAAQPGSTVVALDNANCKLNNGPDNCDTENSQPTWAPPGDLQWIAFNTQRAYGVVSPGGVQQIWVAAVDPAALGGTADPSFPAFRLQFQGLAENNHRAYWTLDIRETPPPPPVDAGPGPDAMCIQTGHTCDQVGSPCCDPAAVCDAPSGGTPTCFVPALP
jgi:WD40 repeat protein